MKKFLKVFAQECDEKGHINKEGTSVALYINVDQIGAIDANDKTKILIKGNLLHFGGNFYTNVTFFKNEDVDSILQ